MSRPVAMIAVLAFALLSLGCVERRLVVTSEPSGALVYLNDQEVGRTPLEVPFTWYGTYDVRLEQAGYTTLQTQRVAERPWWETPGPDLFAEAIPNTRVEVAWHLQMQPEVALPEDRDGFNDYVDLLLSRAKQMRASNQRD